MERRAELESLFKINDSSVERELRLDDSNGVVEELERLLPSCDIYRIDFGDGGLDPDKAWNHIFAVVDNRYLLDPRPERINSDVSTYVYDLSETVDAAFIQRRFGDPATWSWFNKDLNTFMLDLEYAPIYPEKIISLLSNRTATTKMKI